MGHHQVVLEEYTNGDRIHLYIPQESPDVDLSGPKLVVTQTTKTFVCVMITPPFLFVSTTNRMQLYMTCRHH
jgi:hypothetical protein